MCPGEVHAARQARRRQPARVLAGHLDAGHRERARVAHTRGDRHRGDGGQRDYSQVLYLDTHSGQRGAQDRDDGPLHQPQRRQRPAPGPGEL